MSTPLPSGYHQALSKILADSALKIGLTLTDGHDLHVEALSHLQKAVTLQPDSSAAVDALVNALSRHAASLIGQGKLLDAENLLRKALFFKPLFPDAVDALANILFKRADDFFKTSTRLFSAECFLRDALSLKPAFSDAAALLDAVLKAQTAASNPSSLETNPRVEAEAKLRRAAASNPKEQTAVVSLLVNLHDQAAQSFNNNDFAESECAFRKALALQNLPPISGDFVRLLSRRSVDLYNALKFDEAETILWEALSFNLEDEAITQILSLISRIVSRFVPNVLDTKLVPYAREMRSLLHVMDPVGASFIRKGGSVDGGYVMVDHNLNNAIVYSLGVGNDVSWDMDMANMGCQIFLYDHTVKRLPAEHPNFHWFKTGIAGKPSDDKTFCTIEDLIAQNGHKGRTDLILKTDIESAEWDMFADMPEEVLCQFSQIVGEFHRIARFVDPQYRDAMLRALRKINKHFQLVHAHANNLTGMILIAGVPIYYCMELAFVRRSDHTFEETKRSFPSALDFPCVPGLPDMFLGGFGV